LNAYADSSFILALYLPGPNSSAAIAFMQSHRRPLPFNPWHRLEVRNAIRMAVFHKLIEAAECKTQLKQLDLDLQDGFLLEHTPMDWVTVLRTAEKLGGSRTETTGCRSGDLLHVAAAVDSKCNLFLSFDERQRKMASTTGLSVAF
jgi:predicted nucleic acid-binding protein